MARVINLRRRALLALILRVVLAPLHAEASEADKLEPYTVAFGDGRARAPARRFERLADEHRWLPEALLERGGGLRERRRSGR